MAAGGSGGPINQNGVQEDLKIIQAYEQALGSLSSVINKDNEALSQLSTQVKNFNAGTKGFQTTAKYLGEMLSPNINRDSIKNLYDYISVLGRIQPVLDNIFSSVSDSPDKLKYLSKALNPTINEKTITYLTQYKDILSTMQPVLENNATAMLNYTAQLTNFKNELRGIVGLNKNGKLNLGFNYEVNERRHKQKPNELVRTVLDNGDTVDGEPKKSKKGKSPEDIIEGQFRDLTKQILNGTDIVQKESARKWNNLATAVFGTLASNSGNKYVRSAASIIEKGIDIKKNREKQQRYSEIAANSLKVSQTASSAKVASAAAGTYNAASTAAQGSGVLATAGTAGLAIAGVVAIVTAVVAAVAALGVAAQKTADRQSKVARSLAIMDQELNYASKTALDIHNKQVKLGNAFENVADFLSTGLLPILDGLVTVALKAVEFVGIDTKESYVKQTNVKGAISSSAQQSGFNVGSANVLANDTYKIAEQNYERFNTTTENMAKELADAWLTGSDAAKDYGVVVDDLTLIGYTASKGIDIVNVEISDAMRQYYRFQLMQEELNRTSDEAMSQQIRSWKQYGQLIDSTKQKLFSFDEVIQLTAVDTTIPDLGRASLNETLENKITNPTIPPTITTNPFSPFTVPVSPIVNPPVTDVIAELESIPENIDVGVEVVGEEKVRQLQTEIDALSKAVGVNIVTNVQGKDQVDQLIDACMEATKPWEAQLKTTVPQYELIEDILNKYRTLDGTDWQAKLHLLTLGQETIDQAYDSLVQVQGKYYADVVFNISGLSDLQKAVALARELNGMKSGAYASVTSYNNRAAQSYMNESAMQAASTSGKNRYLNNKIAQDYMNESAMQAASTSKNKVSTASSNNVSNIINSYVSTHPVSNQKLTNKQNAYEFGTTFDKNIKALAFGLTLATGAGYSVGALTAGSAGATSAGTSADIISRSELLEAYFKKHPLTSEAISSTFMNKASGFASGGIGTKESMIHAFEGDKAEAVIPLESQQGVDYLANALKQAGAGDGGGSSSVVVNVNLSGLNLADNDAQWERVGRKISEVIEIQTQRRGKLSYGSK